MAKLVDHPIEIPQGHPNGKMETPRSFMGLGETLRDSCGISSPWDNH
jgi:hypothetical protein